MKLQQLSDLFAESNSELRLTSRLDRVRHNDRNELCLITMYGGFNFITRREVMDGMGWSKLKTGK